LESLVSSLVEFAEACFRGDQVGEAPKQLSHLWEQFLQVGLWRKFERDTNAPIAIGVDVIRDWASAAGIKLDEFSLEVFAKLEASFWNAQNPQAKPGSLTAQFAALKTIPVNPRKKK
jgi:hypothetical protein